MIRQIPHLALVVLIQAIALIWGLFLYKIACNFHKSSKAKAGYVDLIIEACFSEGIIG